MILYEVPLPDAFELLGILDDRNREETRTESRQRGTDLRGFHERAKAKRRSRGRR